jgi:hypothetical protein
MVGHEVATASPRNDPSGRFATGFALVPIHRPDF